MFRLNTFKKPKIFAVFLLIIVGFFIYAFNVNNPLFWDDDDWIINNNFVHTVSWDNIKFWLTHNTLGGVGLKSNYYRPFLFFTFALNYMVSGVKPLAYHLTSNSIHIFNSILIFLLFNKVFNSDGRFRIAEDQRPKARFSYAAFLTAILFLVHPLQTEAVTYISGRGDLLVAMFMLLALLFFYKSESTASSVANSVKSKFSTFYFLLSTLFLILGLLSRETGIIFPFLALVFYVSFISPKYPAKAGTTGQAEKRFIASIKDGLIKTWPYFAIVFIYGILRLTVLNFLNTLNFYAVPNIYSENLSYRLLTFMHVLIDYFKLLFIPTNLHMERSMTVHTSLFQWPVWLGFSIVLAILLIIIRFYYLEIRNPKLKIEKQNFRILFFGWGLFFAGLSPVSGITPINAVIYEHWLYLPMVGFWLMMSFYLVKLFDYLKFRKFSVFYFLLSIFLVVYLSFFAYQSIRRNILWGNPLAFYLDILKYEPDSTRINNNVGNIYYNKNDLENAEKYYKIAASQEDIFAEPHFNLGGILQSRGDIYGAIKEYEKAIEINPNFYYPYQNLAVIYAQQGNLTKAAENIEKLKLIIPNNSRVYYNSALVYVALDNKEQALADLKEGLKYISLDPETGELIKELIRQLQK